MLEKNVHEVAEMLGHIAANFIGSQYNVPIDKFEGLDVTQLMSDPNFKESLAEALHAIIGIAVVVTENPMFFYELQSTFGVKSW